jgi:polyisoprenoid-binding protein YceI
MAIQSEAGPATHSVWQFDPMHTVISFAVKHLGMMTVRGDFSDVTASGTLYPENPEASSVDITLQVASLRTNNPQRDKDVLSSRLLEADAYPTITFKSTKIESAGEDRYQVIGDLTIKGNTRSVELSLTRLGELSDPIMGHRIGYNGEGQIDRKDFGMTASPMFDGRFIIGDEVKISLEGELVEKPAE